MLSGRRTTRAGFTLIEILAVIGIMLLLISIFVVTMGGGVNSARVQATRTTVQKVNGLLQQRLDAFYRDSELNVQHAGATAQQILDKKEDFRKAFPQNSQDVQDAASGTTISPRLGETGAGAPPGTGNAEVLYYFLTSSAAATFSAPSGDVSFSASETADADGDDFLELVDSWGLPLRFYRWPTLLIRPDGANQPVRVNFAAHLMNPPATPKLWVSGTAYKMGDQVVSTDDEDIFMYVREIVGTSADEPTADADGQLVPDGGTPDVWRAVLNPLVVDPNDPGAVVEDEDVAEFHTPRTWHAPLVVSAGPDGVLGLLEPDNGDGRWAQPVLDALDATYDDITNLGLQAGNN